jgi:squalene-hopene/tetraprenyl-beta-curcumene cyclase
VDWLLQQQYRVEHPYTHAAPGGWAWTDLPGGVPDADDTAGALVALHKMRSAECGVLSEDITRAAHAGLLWLLGLQNRDGGIPTFCRGWGALPFDQSSADITAHAMRAWVVWSPHVAPELRRRLVTATRRATEFLERTQREDGSFAPLWFGNQFVSDESNRTYGTSRVLEGLSAARDAGEDFSAKTVGLSGKCIRWLANAQNPDGGWGGDKGIDSSVEETALAVEALAKARSIHVNGCAEAIERGVNWLVARVESGAWCEPSPIGFYFAKLWYHERLYPLIFTVGALRAAVEGGRENG